MAPIAGKYKLESNENFVAYLQSLGVPEDNAVLGDKLRPTLEVKVDGNKYSLLSDSGVKNTSTVFTAGEEFDDVQPTEHVLKSIATVSGNVITIKSSISSHGIEGSRTYEFSDAGLVITYTNNKFSGSAKRNYKRV